MTPLETFDALCDHLEDVVPQHHLYRDGDVPGSPAGQYIVAFAGAGSPDWRDLSHHARRLDVTHRLMCVNNTPGGAVLVARDVVAVLDNHALGTDLVSCSAGPTIADPDMQTGYRWSVTVEATVSATVTATDATLPTGEVLADLP